MLRARTIGAGMAGAAVAAIFAGTLASAQTFDKTTYFTFSGPVEIPGAVLPAGQYTVQLTDPIGSRSVMQVTSRDGQKLYGLFLSIPAERPRASDEAEVTLMEAAPGAPTAIKTFWWAGEKAGRELIYPREQARRIAKTATEPVLTTKADTTKADEAKSGELDRIEPGSQDNAVAAADSNRTSAPAIASSSSAENERQTPAAMPTPAPTAMARNNTAPAPVGTSGSSADQDAADRSALPKTASTTPLLLLCGLGLLSVAGAFRAWRMSRVQ